MQSGRQSLSLPKDNGGIEFKIITEDELGIKQYGRGTGTVPRKRNTKKQKISLMFERT